MKRLIRFLARITGVEKDIHDETVLLIANWMKTDAWWFSSDGDQKAYNAFHLYADGMKRLKRPPHINFVRDRVHALGDNQIDGHNTEKVLDCEWK